VQVPVHNISGEIIEQIEINDAVFGVPFNEAVVHQALVRQLANARVGTANTKTRGEVAGSTRKIYRQKGTGRARQGSIRAPHRRGGGVVFGPKPRSFRQDMPKKMRRLALRCVLSSKAAEGDLRVVDKLELEKPSTKEMAKILNNLKVDASALVVIEEPKDNVSLSARNLPKIKAVTAPVLNVADLLSHQVLVMTVPAVRQAENLWGGQKSAQGENSASV
jgi:large subunit ribosomal protein L4